MERTSSHLSTATKLTGLLLAPPLKQTTLARVDLIPLEDDRALAVLVTDAGWVTARAVTLDPPLGHDEVRAIGRELNRRYSGRTVQDVVDMEAEPRDPLDTLHTRARAVIEQIVAVLRGRTLYVSGAINMLDHPEFLNLETTRELLRTFEQKERLADLMTELAGSEGVNVTIGDENPVAEMRECTLITSTYTLSRPGHRDPRRRGSTAVAVSRGHFDRQRDGSPRHRRSFPRSSGSLPALLALEAAGGPAPGRVGPPGI